MQDIVTKPNGFVKGQDLTPSHKDHKVNIFGGNCKSDKKEKACHSHGSGNPVFINMLQKFLDSRLHGNDDFCNYLFVLKVFFLVPFVPL